MDIAALSMSMATVQFQQQKDMALLDKAMDLQQMTADSLVEIMGPPALPPSSHKLDVRV